MYDLLICNGQVVTPAGIFRADIAITGEHIVAVGQVSSEATRIIDANGCYVMPGLVDAHVHMKCSAWNAVSPNDFFHGTVAAALGGVTTVVDFATQTRGRPMIEAADKLRGQAEKNSVVDYGMHLSITDAGSETLKEIEEIISIGIPSFKMFMTYKAHNIMLEDGEILEILCRIRDCKGLAGVHAENDSIAARNYRRFEAEGQRSARYHALAKPNYVEGEAINRVLYLARIAGCPIYIYHLSTGEGVQLVRQARRAGQHVLAETCTHYLTLTRDLLDRPDGLHWLCSPPLRDHADQEMLWDALNDGTIAVISTDEAGFHARDKDAAAGGPLENVPNGLPGVEFRLPVIFTTGVLGGRISLEKFVALNSTNPAKVFGYYPRKGAIAPGSDADLIVVDPMRTNLLSRETQNMQVDWCAYEGMEVKGYPAYTILRGRVIVENYSFCGSQGSGKFLFGSLDKSIHETLNWSN
jgi:dihydropyrimidinase